MCVAFTEKTEANVYPREFMTSNTKLILRTCNNIELKWNHCNSFRLVTSDATKYLLCAQGCRLLLLPNSYDCVHSDPPEADTKTSKRFTGGDASKGNEQEAGEGGGSLRLQRRAGPCEGGRRGRRAGQMVSDGSNVTEVSIRLMGSSWAKVTQ